ncbi:Na+/H+ antiporter [Sphaerisporangium rufum]|uniref:Na+/H+ antiporter n=1 Tax=Sphaerisporangium rufum TaxID=1381558 RepID=A0A919R3G0_9ACTN|nr:Na+/H+ antiporter [Sphaerisporangium rufum]GII78977.1 Na+/H+ antiporter [Sphaerisporangium rufum]
MITEYLIIAAVIAVIILTGQATARWAGVPSAIPLVLFGAGAGFLPVMAEAVVPPDVILNLYLPLLVYHAAFLTAPRETRRDAVPISALAFGLTCVTAIAVAGAVQISVPAIGWAAALALGAAVAPTDPVSATSIMQRVGAPRRMVTILEGESLVNDAVALTLFGLAITALSEKITLAAGGLMLLRVVVGGVLYGLLVGWLIARIRRRIVDTGAQIVVSLVTPFLAYLPAEHFGMSGVLATVTTGFYLGTRANGLLQPKSRLAGTAFWDVLAFLLESSLFVLLGLELRQVLAAVSDYSAAALAGAAVLIIGVVVLVRPLWTLAAFPLVTRMTGRHLSFEHVGRAQRLVMGWAGMRGAITLGIALSIPMTVPHRPLLIFLAAAVVLATLLGQATTLGPLLRRLGLGESGRTVVEEARAREAIVEAAVARLDDLTAGGEVDEHTAQVYRQLLELRLDKVRAFLGDTGTSPQEPMSSAGTRPGTAGAGLRRRLAQAQRERLEELYRKGKVSADIRRRLIHELDLDAHRRSASAH